MQKIKGLISCINLMCFILAGCGSAGITSRSESDCLKPDEILKETIKGNISEYGFYIQKGKITILDGNKKTDLLFTMKYTRGENYLVSIRSLTGIEAMRVLLTKDTILVNDRINRQVLYGESEDFRRISGIPAGILKICVGDLAGNNIRITENEKVKPGAISISSFYYGINLKSAIDCKLKKVIKTRLFTDDYEDLLEINYSDFRGNNLLLPGKAGIVDSKRNVKIKIEIKKFIVPWYGDLDFIPGTNFTLKRI
ncbi:MAG TPA: DUF4292 domain-containing protein [Bacteroidales bacterium]|nr:DUF4292 domain-containing protein [Bacteroidales bacterium]HRT88516.1 DUF4292 domain-containing protein [Bacteroidales bacterium]